VQDQEKIENTFRYSSSQDELFDAFREAIRREVKNPETFKILLANPTLSPDEIKMYTEKLIRELPHSAFDFNMWTASVFENYSNDYEKLEDAFNYYYSALFYKPTSPEPLLRLLNLYNYEIDLPSNGRIVNLIEDLAASVENKSRVYYALANHFRKTGNNRLEVKYLALAEKSAEREDV